LWADESGATAIEYALVCAIIATALVAIMGTGGALNTLYEEKVSKVIEATGGSPDDP
jgi:Flp pilus assembly pilin Flp